MMSSRFYMLLAAAGFAGVLFSMGIVFGLGLLSSPEKIQADGVSPYLARVEGAADRARRVEQDQRVLSPIYPSSPQVAGDGAPAAQVAATDGSAKEKESAPAKLDQTKQVLTQPAPEVDKSEASAAPPPQAAEAKTVATTTGSAETDAKPAPVPASTAAAPAANATPIPNASANSCNVSACAAAYRSFRESDCTYQPFDGPRRLCTNPPAPTQASASTPAPARQRPANAAPAPRPPVDLDDAADEVRRLTREDGVYPPPSMRDGSRVIVIDR